MRYLPVTAGSSVYDVRSPSRLAVSSPPLLMPCVDKGEGTVRDNAAVPSPLACSASLFRTPFKALSQHAHHA